MTLSRQTLELSPRTDGPRYRRVTLTLERDGTLVLRSHEMGGAPEAAWGVDDDETTVSVPPEAIGRITLALAADLLQGGRGAVDRLAELCDAHDVPFRIACWT
jgi:hypothetical protein